MKKHENIEDDFKKWLLYTANIVHYEQLYALYQAVKNCQTTGEFQIEKQAEGLDSAYLVTRKGSECRLRLSVDRRRALLQYIDENYFQNQHIEEWYERKRASAEKAVPSFVNQKTESLKMKLKAQIRPHKKESFYYSIMLAVSIPVYLLLAVGLIYGFVADRMVFASVLFVLFLAFLLFLLQRIVMGIFVGMMKGNSIQLNSEQYPEVYRIVEDQAKQLGLNKLPEIYIMNGPLNAFVANFARKRIMVLFAEIVETALRGDDSVLKFVIAHELGHIKRNHLTKRKWLLPASFVPLLGLAYSRGCEYTCDRIGYHASPQGAVDGLMALTVGKEIYSRFDADKYIQDETKSFWMWFSEKFMTHPHLKKRLQEIHRYHSYRN